MSNKLARVPGRTKAYWLNHIKQWHSSGLSKAAYCRKNNLSAGNFYNWFSKESLSGDAKKRDNQAEAVKFVPLTVTDSVTRAATVTLQSNGVLFRFPADLPADEIERWLSAIERQGV